MPHIDAKWLDILKASGWKTTAVAGAAALVIYANAKNRLLVPLDRWMIQAAEVVLALCLCLTLSTILSHFLPWVKQRVSSAWTMHKAKGIIVSFIPEMTPKEREIIGYLLAHNQRMFTCTPDGGFACTLIAKGVVVNGMQRGQQAHPNDIPFEVQPHAWDILKAHKDKFPYTPPEPDALVQPHPWRVRWMAR